MPLVGAPRDLYMQLLACSCSQSVVAIACSLCAFLCFGFFPPSLLKYGPGKYWSVSIPLNLFSVRVPGGGRSQGCHGYLLLTARLHQLCRHQRPSSSIGEEFNPP